MSNTLYDSGREGILDRTIDMTAATVKVVLLDTYTYTAAHKFISDITGAGGTLVGTATALTSKTYTAGVFDAADVIFSAVASRPATEGILIFNDTGTATTSRVIAYLDTGSNLPVTPNGGDIQITWDNGANKIFKL